MEKYLKAGSSFLRRQYLPHLLLALLLCVMSWGFVSFRNLSSDQAAKVMEMFVSFNGILLLPPLFMPEQNREIWLLEKSKRTPLWHLYIIRLIEAILVLAVIVTGFEYALYLGNSKFSVWQLWTGSFCEILCLGAVGFFASAVTNQVVLGYMASIIYYMANIGGSRYFGKFALFQMTKGVYDFRIWMLIAALILMAAGIFIREYRNQ